MDDVSDSTDHRSIPFNSRYLSNDVRAEIRDIYHNIEKYDIAKKFRLIKREI
jgi:hypothetical protein